MVDNTSYSDDISALWGTKQESVPRPSRPDDTIGNGWDSTPAPDSSIDVPAAADEPPDPVARLAEALAGHRVDFVRRDEFGIMRAEIEDAITQRLAVALYELLSATNDRFSSVEARLDRRMQDMAAELIQSMTANTERLALTVDAQQGAIAELARTVRDGLTAMNHRVGELLDNPVAGQLEIYQAAGPVDDLVTDRGEEGARRSENDVERTAEGDAAMSDPTASESFETITERVVSVQKDLAEVHRAIRTLREEMGSLRRRSGALRRRSGLR